MADVDRTPPRDMPSHFSPGHQFANDPDFVELKVGGVSPPKQLAGSIKYHLEQNHTVALAAIGHQAIGQAMKAIPILNGMTAAHGYIMAVMPWFDIKIVAGGIDGKGAERTAVMLHLVKVRPF
jgi:stage V sporulation protein SpoVS